ncbi:MAG: tRNA (adenosine(37)-N6)-threonylcarbamoyltransferase complex transferase subunit TsaD [Chloroflexota bacterium]|nr:MAG: tRNA (adenosine(37)-N6)-threonylcarbamoyltransferase complex transferase subunit TsaD [Chloroflexota bacterium]
MPVKGEHFTRILAIESSCDETAAAVVENGTTIVSNVIASQSELHAQYGGVFPEVASRRHIEVIFAIIDQALHEAHLSVDDLDCVAVTRGPGLVGSLLVGLNVAKGIVAGRNKPLLGINHIEGHIYSLWLTDKAKYFEFPIVILVVSGGHTELYLMKDHLSYEHLGGTMDDAAGEAFDKVGRLLGLPYPGGPAIDEAAVQGSERVFVFPRPVMDETYNFSFSGLKTAVMRESQRFESGRLPVADLAAGFQAAVVDVLVAKTSMAAEATGATAVHLAGGVSANRALRGAMDERLEIPVHYPPPELCTDNAAMIGAAAHWRFVSGQRDPYSIDVAPGLRL